MRARSRSAHLVLTTAGVCALLLTSGCGPSSGGVDSADPGPATTRSSPASIAAAPTAGAEKVAAGELTGIHPDARPASLRVSVSPAAPGVPARGVPGGLLSAVCGLPDHASRYATITVTFTDRGPGGGKLPGSSNLRADVTVEGGAGVGVFERSDAVRSEDAARYCPGTLSGGTSMQTEELSQAHQTMTLYAVAPAGPGPHDPFDGTTVRVEGLRVGENSISTRPWNWGLTSVTEGNACPDDPNALCLPVS